MEEILDESLVLASRTYHDMQLPPWGLRNTVVVVVAAAAASSSWQIAAAAAAAAATA